MEYVARAATRRLQDLLRNFPVVLVYGPRQCGKSTLVRAICPDWTHLDLERPGSEMRGSAVTLSILAICYYVDALATGTWRRSVDDNPESKALERGRLPARSGGPG